MKDDNSATQLLRDLVLELLEQAREAKAIARGGSDFDKGRHLALYEVVSLIHQQALTFGVPLKEIGLEKLDLERDMFS